MNKWMAHLKKRSMHAYQNNNVQNKSEKLTLKIINSKAVTDIVEKPRENSEMCENVKVSNN